MEEKKYFENFCAFVNSTASEDSKNNDILIEKIKKIKNFAMLDAAFAGIAGEAGEVIDAWKKIKFHQIEFTEERRDNLIKELGDIFWYLALASNALEISMDEIINRNIEKISQRHKNGFSNDYMKK